MTTNEAIHTDILWEEMKNLAVEQQQCFYEFLPDCKRYQHNEHKYLKYDIGYAMYGPPEIQNNANTTEDNNVFDNNRNKDSDIADITPYNEEQKLVIDMIYNKICECTKETVNSQTIYLGIIYNIVFRPKVESNIKEEQKLDLKTEKEIPETKEKKEKEEFSVTPRPLYKLRKSTQMKTDDTKLIKVEEDYVTWYIDINGRVYKDWADYITSNNLPQCTMVVPKDGYYQPDISQPITEDYSSVWLDIIDSPACAWTSRLCDGIDFVNGVVGMGALGLGIASMFTPLAPVVAVSGLAAAGTTGAWTLGRSTQRLYDHVSHEGSVLDTEVLPQWLGIAGTAFGLGAIGGTLYISTVVERGVAISNATRIVFNTIQGGNVLINGVGIAHQIYSIYDRYRTGVPINNMDVIYLLAHIMFFTGSVMNIESAETIIRNTQGRIIDDYRQSLPNRRFRKAFNRARRNAAAKNSDCKISENAQVIRYINNRTQLLSSDNLSLSNSTTGQTSYKTPDVTWSFEDNKLRIGNIILLDPIRFGKHFIEICILSECNQDKASNSRDYDTNLYERLLKTLDYLLTNFYLSTDCPESKNLPTMPDFESLLKEMASMNINEDFLCKLFQIVAKLMKHSKNTHDFLLKAFYFIWMYCKENLKQWGINSCYRMQSIAVSNLLKQIMTAIFEAIDMIIANLYIAFKYHIAAALVHEM